jgi:hypothetical protein
LTYSWRLLVLALFIGVPCIAWANTFGAQDIQVIDELERQLLQMQQDDLRAADSLIAQRAFDSVECLNQIRGNIETIEAHVSEISTLIRVSSRMATPADESVVNGYMADQIKTDIKYIALGRIALNRTSSSSCGTNPFIATKMRAALSLLDDSEHILLWLQQRL